MTDGSETDRPPPPLIRDTGKTAYLTILDYETDPPRQIARFDIRRSSNWSAWQRFLLSRETLDPGVDGNNSFRYTTSNGLSFTCVCEVRSGGKVKRKPKRYWYAHKKIGGKLKRRYLGVSQNLTASKLYATAFDLAQLDLLKDSGDGGR